MRVVQVISSVYDEAAGTTYAVRRLCETLGRRGLDVALHTLEPVPDALPVGYRRIGYRPWAFPLKLGISNAMRTGIRRAAAEADLVHNNGLWMMPNIYSGAAARRARRPFVFSPHGMLAASALQRSRWKKAIMNRVVQRGSLNAVNCFHATAPSEYQAIREFGLTQPVAIVPYGVDIPPVPEAEVRIRRRLLFFSRIHPIKRVDVLITAWRAVQQAFPDWDLVICGPDNDGHLPAMQRLAESIGAARVNFLGPKYAEDKEILLNGCDLLVLPSRTENFGFVVAEALAHGKPAIVTNTAPWSGLVEHRCGWWIDAGLAALEASLRQALALEPAALFAMGLRGREWMIRDLCWERVGEMMDLTYQWLLGLGGRPDWVHVD